MFEFWNLFGIVKSLKQVLMLYKELHFILLVLQMETAKCIVFKNLLMQLKKLDLNLIVRITILVQMHILCSVLKRNSFDRFGEINERGFYI